MYKRITCGVMAVIFLTLLACSDQEGSDSAVDKNSYHYTFAEPIQQAHNYSAWQQKGAFVSDVNVTFGGQTILQGKLITETDGVRTRLEISEDTIAVYYGKDI
ncbi:hypothetical protein BH23BAC3_BH23BAC3_28640 [soil metagenome]